MGVTGHLMRDTMLLLNVPTSPVRAPAQLRPSRTQWVAARTVVLTLAALARRASRETAAREERVAATVDIVRVYSDIFGRSSEFAIDEA